MRRGTNVLVAVVAAATVVGIAASAAGAQSNNAYASSNAGIANVFATTQKTSCYTPEVPFFVDLGPALGYSGMTPCNGAATTGEALGPYPTQAGSNPGYPATTAMLVKNHSESDIRVDPTNADHVIGTSKWFVSSEGYNHLLGFYEKTSAGSWIEGHIPGYEGWTDDTDPVGAFDRFGNFWFLNLAYQFFYRNDGSHNFTVGKSQEPNPVEPAEVIGASVRPHGSTTATQWGAPETDVVAAYDSVGNEPDKQWITVDTSSSPTSHPNRIYAMWVDFHFVTPVPYVSYADATMVGTHTPWSTPQRLPEPPHTPTGATYLLPHVAPNGDVYTPVTNFDPAHQYGSASIFIDKSTDGGATWQTIGSPISLPSVTPEIFANTTFRDGIIDTFAVGSHPVDGHYPLYVAYEDYSAGVSNVLLTVSYDDGVHWEPPITVNDNTTTVDEFQPNLSVAPSGTVSVAWYDRRLACPTAGSAEANAAGITAFDPAAAGRTNYCVNTSVQFYDSTLHPLGTNVRLTQHTWDPQLNAPHTGSPTGTETFIGDYFGNDASVGTIDWFSFVSTYNDGSNPQNRQQQVVVAVPTRS
ncbi:MAG TPA: hypothetical protein VHQ89_14450 [Gaiellaceae bacterium]|nr:hypothetical protein [Gaiellaceae bacterium]